MLGVRWLSDETISASGSGGKPGTTTASEFYGE